MKKVEIPVFVLWLLAIPTFNDFAFGLGVLIRDLTTLYHFLFGG